MAELSYKDWIDSFNENFPYSNPAPTDKNNEQFPIITSAKKKYDENDKPIYDFIGPKEAAFNVLLIGLKWEEIVDCLNLASDNNLKLIVHNWELFSKKSINDIFNNSNNITAREAFGGISIKDEPTYKMMLGEEFFEEDFLLPACYRFIMTVNDNPLVYINLIGSGEKYSNYVSEYQKLFKPSFFSYDLYPILEYSPLLYKGIKLDDKQADALKTKKEGQIVVDDGDWFYNDFNLFSNISKETERPFWAFCQSMSFMVLDGVLFRPIAKEEYLRFEAFSALAFGAKGIIYWTYSMRESNTKETYFSALLDRNDNKTASWYYAKKINEEIQKYRDVFLNTELIFAIPVNSNYTYVDGLINCAIDITCDGRIIFAKKMGESGQFLIIVSKDPINYHTLTINVRSGRLLETTPLKSGDETHRELTNGLNKRILIPGGYRIFKLLK